MPDTDFEKVADDRINKLIDLKKITSKEDYQQELERVLNKTVTGRNLINAGKKGKNRGVINWNEIADEMFNGEASENVQKNLLNYVKKKGGLSENKRKKPTYKLTNKEISQAVTKKKEYPNQTPPKFFQTKKGLTFIREEFTPSIYKETYPDNKIRYRSKSNGRFLSFKEEN